MIFQSRDLKEWIVLEGDYIHTYIIGHYNPSVRNPTSLLTPSMLYALILYMIGGTYSLKLTPKDRFFRSFFMTILITFVNSSYSIPRQQISVAIKNKLKSFIWNFFWNSKIFFCLSVLAFWALSCLNFVAHTWFGRFLHLFRMCWLAKVNQLYKFIYNQFN